MKYMREFTLYFSSNPTFNSLEAKRFLANRGASEGYYKLVITNLLKAGKIRRITRGSYTFHDDVQYVGFAFRPFYYGLEDALSFHGLWDQETNPVILTPKRVRPGIRTFDGRNYLVRHIDRKMFFGFVYKLYEDFNIPVSTVEKTFIDLLYFGIHVTNEVLENILDAIDVQEMAVYLEGIPKNLKLRIDHLLKGKIEL